MNYLRKMQLDNVFKQIAEKEGITVQEVKEEMKKTIAAATSNKNPEMKLLLKNKFDNRTPTPEEFMMLIVNELK